MLKLFGRNASEHPLADLKSAKRVLAALPASDPYKSLEEIAHWLESVRKEADFKPEYRAQLAQLLDEAGQAPVRRLAREYLSSTRLNKQQETRLWTALHEFWHQSARAFTASIDECAAGGKPVEPLKPMIPLLAIRALRALAAEMKWLHVRYGPVDAGLWAMAARVHAFAECRRVASTSVQVYASVPGESTVEQEFLRLLMFSACSPDSLMPLEIELAERVIAHFSVRFTLGPDMRADAPYWIDLGAARAPRRGVRPLDIVGPLRFLGAGGAFDGVRILKGEIRASGSVPSQLNLGGAYDVEQILPVLDHLEMYWAPKLPERRHPRQSVKARLTVAKGFDGILDVVQPGASLAFVGDELESWIAENASAGGFGALVPQTKGDWLRIGSLLALQAEGSAHWSIGVIRRLSRNSARQASVGIQVLTRMALPVELRIKIDRTLSLDTEIGIVLAAPQGGETMLILRPGVFLPGQTFVVDGAAQGTVLVPTRVAERGSDYEILACRQSVRAAA